MSYRRVAGGGKRDAAEPAIVAMLRAHGALVWHIGGAGNPDLLVRYRGVWTPLEVKTGTGRRTRLQSEIPWPVVRSVDDALRAVAP
jgi:hypothetical protein